jgi:uncharacterized SAM-binding protein YcdF (DUF218 family)
MEVASVAKNVLGTLLLPPASLLIPIAIGLWYGRVRWGRWLAGTSLVALTLLSLSAFGTLLGSPFERAYRPIDLEVVKSRANGGLMVVILGGGRDLGGIEYPEGERLNDASLRRTRYGARVAATLGVPIAVSGGKPSGGTHSEAALMKRFLEGELNRRVALVEDTSFDTRQNAQHLVPRLRKLGVREVILVTDVTHMPRAARTFHAVGLHVIPAPLHYHADAPLNVASFLPTPDGLRKSHQVLRELLGEIWYRLSQN